ncbi:MAG: hypothetical protein KC517_09145 [Bacteroidetes bacterium]|nr:hypothetical protein [Bacteroidota bacterium]
MPPNVTVIAGASQVDWYLGNYTYADIVASMENLKFKLATDLNRFVYKNAAGTSYKLMADGSTTSNIPINSVLFADTNGAAINDTGFLFNNSTKKMYLPGDLEVLGDVRIGDAGAPAELVDVLKAQDDNTSVKVTNTNNHTSARADFCVVANVAQGLFAAYPTTATTANYRDKAVLISTTDLALVGLSDKIEFYANGATLRAELSSTALTLSDGVSFNLQETINFTGTTGINKTLFPDNLADAYTIGEGANAYLTFISTDAAECLQISKDTRIGDVGTPAQLLDIRKDQNSPTVLNVENATTGNSASAGIHLRSNANYGSLNAFDILSSVIEFRNKILLYADPNNDALMLAANGAGNEIQFYVGGLAAANKMLVLEETDLTLSNGVGLNLQEDITFAGATEENKINIPDNLNEALLLTGGDMSISFKTTNSAEAITIKTSTHVRLYIDDNSVRVNGSHQGCDLFVENDNDSDPLFKADVSANSGGGAIYANLRTITSDAGYLPVYISDSGDELVRFDAP